MKVVVQDASVLIDLAAADLLGAWFSLSAATAITKLELLCRLNPRLQKRECEPLLAKWRNA